MPKSFAQQIVRAVKRHKYDEVIHFTSYIDDFEPIKEIQSVITSSIDWGWGYDSDSFSHNEDELKWVIASYRFSAHPTTWIPPELRDWKPNQFRITLGGGYGGECLGDMEAILTHLILSYKKAKCLIYPHQK
jgi:hypothetical protein